MSDSDGRKTLGLGGSRPGSVKQSFSHGRTKNVVVETKRKRVVVPKPGGQKQTGPGAGPVGDPSRRPAGITDSEMDRRLKAVQAAKAREVEEAAAREAEEKARAEDRDRRRAEIEAKEQEDREREESLKAKPRKTSAPSVMRNPKRGRQQPRRRSLRNRAARPTRRCPPRHPARRSVTARRPTRRTARKTTAAVPAS